MVTPLTAQDRDTVREAVRTAEARTRGEIFCVAAAQSSEYRETPLAWAAGAALLAPAVLLLAGIEVSLPDALGGGWTAVQAGEMAESAVRAALGGVILLQGVLFAIVLVLVSLPPMRRVLTPAGLKRHRVRRRAHEQFLAHNLHMTRERTGVLIFVSLQERMAELLADEAIAAKVDSKVWDQAMAALTDGLRRGDAGEGFARAIELCADVLAEHFPPGPDNPNELSDVLVELPGA
ncbi:TPM domain-containing protein [Phenylobacterium sp.]|uniref:TPM domain-containing protein n=1 Tax=Phenylobacterium sp. TaxID=1871053 RepID=UPI002735D2D8|nr:TPM domain-containing protein [Phenylobacterium sp.]MDP3658726.1 TPM domain-containing protein [Phenylobacterium sp.]